MAHYRPANNEMGCEKVVTRLCEDENLHEFLVNDELARAEHDRKFAEAVDHVDKLLQKPHRA